MASGTATETGTCTTVEMGRIVVARDSESLKAILGSCIGRNAVSTAISDRSNGARRTPQILRKNKPPREVCGHRNRSDDPTGRRGGGKPNRTGGQNDRWRPHVRQRGTNPDRPWRTSKPFPGRWAEAGIRIAASDVGGSKGRRITFNARQRGANDRSCRSPSTNSVTRLKVCAGAPDKPYPPPRSQNSPRQFP